MTVTLNSNYQATLDDNTLNSHCPVHGTDQTVHQTLGSGGLLILSCGHPVQVLPHNLFSATPIVWGGWINGTHTTLTLTTSKFAPAGDYLDTNLPWHLLDKELPRGCEVQPIPVIN